MKIFKSVLLSLTLASVLPLYSQMPAILSLSREANVSPEGSLKSPLVIPKDSLNLHGEPFLELSLPDTFAAPNRYIDLPLHVKGLTNFDIISALIQVQFDTSCLLGIDVISQGSLTENWTPPVVNNFGTGLYFALAGSQRLSRDGILVYLRFQVNSRAQENKKSDLVFNEIILNEGDVNVLAHKGSFRIKGLQIAGSIIYQGTKVPVPGVEILLLRQKKLVGFSDETGNYSFSQLPYGDFVLTPRKKKDQVRCISPFDAALILQYSVGINQLSPYQLIAADVSGDSSVTNFDAALIMRYAVNLEKKFPIMADSSNMWDFTPTSFLINEKNWMFHPDSFVYQPLTEAKFKQDFIGIVYGDVSQSWTNPGNQFNGFKNGDIIATLKLGSFQILNPGELEVPVEFDFAHSIISAEVELKYPENDLQVVNVAVTELSKNFLINSSHQNGNLKIAMAGANPITGSGELVKIKFRSNEHGKTNGSDKIILCHALLNDQVVSITSRSGERDVPEIPQQFKLSPNYPNPFNQETVFQISITPTKERIFLAIYNLQGQIVRKLIDGSFKPGNYAIHWNGTDDSGDQVTTGEYFCVLRAAKERVMQKFVLLR